jgi:hypothetical protein
MKVKGLSVIMIVTLLISCQDTSDAPLSEGAKQYLTMRMGASTAMTQNMAGAVNNSFGNLFTAFGKPNGRIKGDSTSSSEPGDSTIYNEPWKSCALITETANGDGSHTTVIDYGDGCEEGGNGYTYFMHGKIMYTWLSQLTQSGSVFRDKYFYSSDYDNYGGNYNGQWAWTMDGQGVYQGQSEYDTAKQTFTGYYTYDDETTYTYDSSTYYNKGSGATSYTTNKYIIERSQYEYADGDNYYKSKVLKPLVINYECYGFGRMEAYCWMPVYVSGRERVQYKYGEEEGTFEIDYGDGECDSIIVIYEEGKRTVVDLNTDWYTRW